MTNEEAERLAAIAMIDVIQGVKKSIDNLAIILSISLFGVILVLVAIAI